MNDMKVIKRNGSTEALNVQKIHDATKYATDGLSVSQSELETAAHLMLFDGVKTSDIQKALIVSAAGLISEESPGYTYSAARLLLQTLYKEVTGGPIIYPSLRSYIERGISEGVLDSRLATDFDLEHLNTLINPELDFKFDYLGLQTLADRYFVKERPVAGKKSKIIELPQHFWMRVAMGVALAEKENKTTWAGEFYLTISNFWFVPSTPTLFNAGTNHPQLSSCYGNTVEDSIDGIFQTMHECARLSKYAGGIGTDWTRVRSAGSPVLGTNGKSSGVIPYLKVFNDTAVSVNQCFAPDTLIRVPDGVKRIADIEIGDLVLGERGEYREVYEVMSYSQKDSMVAIKIKHSLEPLTVTAGHPIFAIKGVANEQSIERTLRQIEVGKHVAEWVDAGNLEKGDYVAQVVPTEIIPVENFEEDDARLYGIMLGDGHCSIKPMKDFKNDDVVAKEYGVTGSSADEETLVFVAEYLTARGIKYGYSATGSGATQIRWSYCGRQQERDENGKFLKGVNCLPFDHEDLYDVNGNKRIARRFTHLPLPQALAIVRGLIDSDGCVSRGKEITFTNTSLALVEGLRYQMIRLGVPTAGNKKVRSNDHLGYSSVTVSWEVRIPAVTELAQALDIPSVTKFNWFRIGNMIFSRVVSAENVEPLSMVYDLKVDGDHTYSTTSALAHNGGKRNGAFAAYLEPWHPDFPDFIDMKKNSGDERRRAHDIYPAAWIPDLFMKRVENDEMWSFISPADVPELHEAYGHEFESLYTHIENDKPHLIRSQMPAKDLWRKMLTSLFETGHPWITFKDTHNNRNPQSHAGVIHNSNLCLEISLNNSDTETFVCNLGSINLSKLTAETYRDILAEVVPVAVRMLDNVIDVNFYPSEKARASNMKSRPIGLGMMGYTELLVKSGIDWESEEHLEFAEGLSSCFAYYATKASCDLARERGAYASFAGSKWDRGILPIDSAVPLTEIIGQDYCESLRQIGQSNSWLGLRKSIRENGMRNCNVTAIAPTATIANIVGTTPCIEPIYERVTEKKNLSGPFTVVDPCLRHNESRRLCKESFDIDQTWVIRAAAIRQRWIDQSQSINLFVDNTINGRKLSELYMLAWKLGLKSTYYLKSRSSKFVSKSESDLTTMKMPEQEVESDLESIVKVCSIENPDCESCQ